MKSTPIPYESEQLKELAFEFALRYYPPEELADRYGVPLATLQQLEEDPRFKRMILVARREIDEAGSQMKIAARKLVTDMVPTIAGITLNEGESTADRLAAFKQLVAIADMDTNGPAQGSGFSVNIQINNQAD